VARLQALRGEGEPAPSWPAHLQTVDEINTWLYQASQGRPVGQVLAESRQVFEQMLAAVEALPEADLADPDRFPWMEGQPLSPGALFAHFHEEHEADMRAWLARQEAR
jgi:hypothetical protein